MNYTNTRPVFRAIALVFAALAVLFLVTGCGSIPGQANKSWLQMPTGTDWGGTTATGTGVAITAEGGVGGRGRVASSSSIGRAGQEGASGGSGGDLQIAGTAATGATSISGVIAQYPISGFSPVYGGGKRYSPTPGSPNPGTLPGEGGAGAGTQSSSAQVDGSDGADGVVVVEEFF